MFAGPHVHPSTLHFFPKTNVEHFGTSIGHCKSAPLKFEEVFQEMMKKLLKVVEHLRDPRNKELESQAQQVPFKAAEF